MELPYNNNLPITKLAQCFNNTVATYKFYWLLSIIEEIEKENKVIPKMFLFARMVANAWYITNYFHVSFGKQDLIQEVIKQINKVESVSVDEKKEIVFQRLSTATNQITQNQLWHFNKNVPHWFLSPWFPAMNRKDIYNKSEIFDNDCLYALYDDRIEMNPKWINYLLLNSKVLKDFCYWNLTLFLQTRNPNVPDIPNKLIRPAERNNLAKQRRNFWDVVINELGSVECIYTGKKLIIGNYSVEHFVPYNFVAHDLIWNLIPSDKTFNSVKSDKLPPLDKYFNAFFELQRTAFEIVSTKQPNNTMLVDYLTIFPDLDVNASNFTKVRFRESIQPLITIAHNNGFEYMR
ncbi:MAG: hypothetical protein K1X91_03800 [Bacteriodetes bacterium]|nr:hypothetical protein [Bacteroidota bacterium]